MARFGLTEDSDDEVLPTRAASRTKEARTNSIPSTSNKGKARATNSQDPETDLSGRNGVAAKTRDTRINANNVTAPESTKPPKLIFNAVLEDRSAAAKFSSEGHSRHVATDRAESKQPVRAVSGETTEDELDYDYNDYDEEEEVFQRRRTSAPPPSWPEQLGLEPYRVHVMQASLFRAPEAKEHEKNTKTDTHVNKSSVKKLKLKSSGIKMSGLEPREHMEKLFSASSKLLRKHSRSSEGDGSRLDRLEECLLSSFSLRL